MEVFYQAPASHVTSARHYLEPFVFGAEDVFFEAVLLGCDETGIFAPCREADPRVIEHLQPPY